MPKIILSPFSFQLNANSNSAPLSFSTRPSITAVSSRCRVAPTAGAGGQAGFHQVAAVYGQLAHGVAGGLGKLGHPGLKGGHLIPPGFDLRRVGVGVQVGIFQCAEPVQKSPRRSG